MFVPLFLGCGARTHIDKSASELVRQDAFTLRLLGQSIMVWGDGRGQDLWSHASPAMPNGFFTRSVPWSGRTSMGGPYGASGLLNLPLSLRPKVCTVATKLQSMSRVVHELERFEGVPSSVVASELKIAGLADDPGPVCQAAAVLDCLTATFAVLPRRGAEGNTASHPALLAPSRYALEQCFKGVGRVSGTAKPRAFGLRDGRIVFEPRRLRSVLIYKGEWPNLAQALGGGPPDAVVPLDGSCATQATQGCLVSPLPIRACIGCSSLSRQDVHSAFLVEEAGVLDENVTPVLFVPES